MTLYYKKRHRKILLFVLPILLFSLLGISFFKYFTPVFSRLSKDRIYYIVFQTISKIIADEIEEIGDKNLVVCQYDGEGKITSINANIAAMNKINNKISTTLSQKLANLDDIYVKVPVGSIIDTNFFSAAGPMISLKIYPLTSAKTQYRTEFEAAGINQTIHRIYIDVNCSVNVLSRLSSDCQEIQIEIPIAETIIVGNVPNAFLSSEDISKKLQ